MRIGDVAQSVGLPVKTVRYYADIGLVAPARRTAAGYRDYGETEVQKLVFIRRARSFGFSVGECRELLSLYEDPERSSGDVKRIAGARLKEIEARQKELQSLHDTLHHLVESCHGDDRPDCPILDHLA